MITMTMDLREIRAYVDTRSTGGGDLDQVLVLTDGEVAIELSGGLSGLSEAARLGAQRIASAAWTLAGIRPLDRGQEPSG